MTPGAAACCHHPKRAQVALGEGPDDQGKHQQREKLRVIVPQPVVGWWKGSPGILALDHKSQKQSNTSEPTVHQTSHVL